MNMQLRPCRIQLSVRVFMLPSISCSSMGLPVCWRLTPERMIIFGEESDCASSMRSERKESSSNVMSRNSPRLCEKKKISSNSQVVRRTRVAARSFRSSSLMKRICRSCSGLRLPTQTQFSPGKAVSRKLLLSHSVYPSNKILDV